jgi:hypothetical protein
MTRVGATGHQDIPAGAWEPVRREVSRALAGFRPPLRIITSLAAGADQLIATEAIAIGGSLEAVIPSRKYQSTFTTSETEDAYRRLLRAAVEVVTLDFDTPSEQAYWEAGKTVADRCEVLLAVWDGQPARGLGGTADVVKYARRNGRRVHVIWPIGISRGGDHAAIR